MSEPRSLVRVRSLSDWRYLFLSLDGRISRMPFWIGTVILIAPGVIVLFTDDPPRPLFILIDFALLYPGFAVMLKRAHDRDMSAILPVLATLLAAIFSSLDFFGLLDINPEGEPDLLVILYVLITFCFFIYCMIVLGFFRGTSGSNRFGPDPLETRA